VCCAPEACPRHCCPVDPGATIKQSVAAIYIRCNQPTWDSVRFFDWFAYWLLTTMLVFRCLFFVGVQRSQDILMMKRKELGQPITTNSDVESLIIIDRASDLFTPMCSQLTYQGPAALSSQLQTCQVFIERMF
jgi:hypothetical protein